MTISVKIKDATGCGIEAGVSSLNAVYTAKVPLTSCDYSRIGYHNIFKEKPFTEFFTNSSGSNNLNIDGSVTPVEFSVRAENEKIKTITSVKFIINDEQLDVSAAEGSRFGSAAAAPGLTNGIKFVYDNTKDMEFFPTTVKQNIEWYYYCSKVDNFVGSLGAGEDAIIANFNFSVPIILPPTTTDRLFIAIQDDLTSINNFRVIAFGMQELI